MKIIIDPGHGGKDPGAVGPTGLHEADVALSIAQALRRLLVAAGHDAVMLRVNDAFMSLKSRTDAANRIGGDALVCIHCNAASSREAHGFEVWTTPGQTKADPLATCIFDALSRGMIGYSGMTGRQDRTDKDPDKEAHFWMLKYSNMPAILSENGFISNAQQEADMKRPEWIAAVAQAHFDGLIAWNGGKV